MKTAIFYLSVLVALPFCRIGVAQFNTMPGDYYIRQVEAIGQDLERRQQELQASMRQNEQLMVQQYRQTTGDHQSSDEAILNHLVNQYFQQNPGAWEQQMRGHQERMAAIQQFGIDNTRRHQERMANSDTMMQNWQNHNAMNDQSHSNFVNGVILEQGQYYNPVTGNQANLGWNTPNQLHQFGGNAYYTDGNYNQFQWDGSNWQQMHEID